MKGHCVQQNMDSQSGHPLYNQKQGWKFARDDLETDECISINEGPPLNNLLSYKDMDECKFGFERCNSLRHKDMKDSRMLLQRDNIIYESDPESVLSVLPPNTKDHPMRSRMTYRDNCDTLHSEVCDSVDRCTSVTHDSGAEFLHSPDPTEHKLTSVCDSGLSYNTSSFHSSMYRPYQPLKTPHMVNAMYSGGGATFACGTLRPLQTVQDNFSKLSLDTAEPSIHATMSKKTEIKTADEQLTAKRHKCSKFDLALMETTNDFAEKVGLCKKQSLLDDFTNKSRRDDCQSVESESCDFKSLRDQDEDGDTLLHIALILNRTDVVVTLMEYITNANDLSIQNNLGQTVLHLGVLLEFSDLLRSFVLHGAQITAQDHHGNTPLHLACVRGDIRSIVALTQPPTSEEHPTACSYSIPFHRIPQDPDLRNFKGLTCLHVAAEYGFLNVLNYLIQYCGADPNAIEFLAGETALHRAVNANNIELVRYLLSFREVDVNSRRYDGCTPLHLASGQSNDSITEMLKDHGAVTDWPIIDHTDITDDLVAITNDIDLGYDDFMIDGSLIT